MTQYTVNKTKAAKLFWPGIIEDLTKHEVLVPEEVDTEYLARGVLQFAALTADFGNNEYVIAARNVIMSRCRHENVKYSQQEYGGGTCVTCGYVLDNDKGLR